MSEDAAPLTVDSAPAPLLVVDDGIVVELNALAEAELALGAVVLLGRRLVDLVDAADRIPLEKALAAEAGTAPRRVEVTMVAGGHRRRIDLLVSVLADRAIAGVRDLSDLRRTSAIIDAVADSTLLMGRDGLVMWQSDRLTARVASRADASQLVTAPGRAPGIGWSPLERIHPEDLPTVLDSFAKAVAEPGLRTRYVVRAKDVEDDSRWQHVEICGTSCLDGELDAIVVQVRVLDDGERVESLAQTSGRLESLADAAPMGILVADHQGRCVYANGAALTVLGLVQLPIGGDWVDLFVDRDQPAVREALEQAAAGATSVQVTAEVDLPGVERWCRISVTPRIVEGGRAIGVIATLEDVSAEVEARAESRRLTEMLDATSDYVAVFRPGGEPLYVNRATRQLLDGLRAEGRPGDLRDLIDDEPRRAWISAAIEVLEHSDVWEGELVLNAPGGRKIPVSALGVVQREPDGALGWIAMQARDISELKRVEAQLREAATHDNLTGLPNRTLFNDRLEQAVARHLRVRRGVAVMFCDLDGFKPINDRYGHAAGDEVLIEIANRLRSITRSSDTAARVGGDEFVVVCEEVTDTDELSTLAERVIDVVREPVTLRDGRTVHLGISVGIGVARSRQGDVDADRLLTAADTAMYRAKARGGNTYRIAALE